MKELRSIATDYSQPSAAHETAIAKFTDEEFSSIIIPDKLHRFLSVETERFLRNLLM